MTAIQSIPKRHVHRPKKSRRSAFIGAVSHRAIPEAHGGYCRIETCECGATRPTNVNGVHTERGVWQVAEYVSSMLSGACLKKVL